MSEKHPLLAKKQTAKHLKFYKIAQPKINFTLITFFPMRSIFQKIFSGLFAALLLAFPVGAAAENPSASPAEQHSVSGTVVDASGSPLWGVGIVIRGTDHGTVTDENGYFRIDAPTDAVLVLSCIGYRSLEISVLNLPAKIIMQEDEEFLDEVVVVGYGTMKKSSLTGSSAHVSTEKMEGFPSVNVMDAMQGLAAGVYISPSRQPGDDPSIQIRGRRSLSASNSPLLIVDGMPGSWENLSTDDIESMEILKDAAASAIYGSRAANGVILVTTKTARSSKIQVSLNSYVGMNRYHFIKYQTAEHYAEMIRDIKRMEVHGLNAEAWENSNIDTPAALEMWNPTWYDNYYNKGISYDWQDALFDDASFNTGHTLSISARTDKLSYKFSYNYQDNNSYYPSVNYKRHILSNNANIKLAEWIDASLITRLSYRKNTGYPGDMVENLIRMTPFETPWVDEDPANGFKNTIGSESYVNAMLNYQEGNYVDDRIGKRADIIGAVNIRPWSWLTFTTNLKLGYNETSRGEYYDSRTVNRNLGYNRARFNKASAEDYTWNAILNFDKTFGAHHINATAVMEAIQEKSESVTAQSDDIPAAYMDYHYLQAGTQNQSLSSSYSRSNLLSYMFRVQYEILDRYMFNVAFRYDGSSRLAPGNQWHLFPSAAAAWRISEEPFLKNSPVISNLKLRASYGEIGNQAISLYQTMTKLKSKTYDWYNQGGFYTWQPDGLANQGLSWEISKTINAGIDFGLWKNRLNGSVEFYRTRNVGLLQGRSIPESTGFSSITQNIGTTQNIGIEASVSYALVSTKDISWNVGVNLSRNWNEIIDLVDGKDDTSNGWYIGKPIRMIREYELLGVWQLDEMEEARKYNAEPGNPKIKDQDGDGKLTDDDKVFIGQRDPKWLASLQTSFRYKNFDLSANFVGQFGYYISASNIVPLWNGSRWAIDAIDWWTPLNPTNDWPRMQTAYTQSNTGLWDIQKGDFIKLQNISLGYDFTSLANRMVHLEKLRAYVQASNLAYLYKACYSFLNPEQPDTMFTVPTSLVFGINLTF